ncbi:hypothetical protein BJX70DRAFT_218597 [Aspergillus crustosus]
MPRSLTSSSSIQSDKTKSSSVAGPSDDLGSGPASASASSSGLTDGNVPTLSLGGIQHVDRQGKVIADPDRSNPTRARLERPLDTIRGFEAAIAARRGGHIA